MHGRVQGVDFGFCCVDPCGVVKGVVLQAFLDTASYDFWRMQLAFWCCAVFNITKSFFADLSFGVPAESYPLYCWD